MIADNFTCAYNVFDIALTSPLDAPASRATSHVCSAICLHYIPALAKVRSAARFCASPTAAMISASFAAVSTPKSASAACAAEWVCRPLHQAERHG